MGEWTIYKRMGQGIGKEWQTAGYENGMVMARGGMSVDYRKENRKNI